MAIPTSGDPRPGRLNGWKEIAAYLDRGVRTVQRWEKTLGLPVRRIGTGRGEVVFALPEELDAWRAASETMGDLSEKSDELDTDESAVKGADDLEGHAAGRPHVQQPLPAPAEGALPPERSAPQSAPETGAPAVSAVRGAGRRWWLAAAVLLATTVAAGAGFLLWQAMRAPASQPSDYLMDMDTLRVFDVQGRELWTDRFPAPAAEDPYGEMWRAFLKDPVVIEDLDGDGSREVIVGYRSGRPDGPSQFRGYRASGQRLFSLGLEASVRFGDTDYNSPWGAYRLFATGAPGGGRWLWVAWTHDSGEFPCLLQRVSLQGKVEAEVWSAGYVESVFYVEMGGTPHILVGTANNDHRGGGLAVFEANAVGGSLPAETWDKTCRTCAPGGPKKLLVFPQQDVMRLVAGNPSVMGLHRQKTGEFRIYVDHGAITRLGALQIGGAIAYDLAPDLTPVLAEFSPEYLAAHARHHAAGLLDHPCNDADRAAAWPVLVWENGTWTKVTGKTDR
ncbi:MAG: hypothetical protein EHM24_20240 [Acidobacteria bacterium]|nr:MAG: hypothetical protein EHM24_20240 [Acidobacteriota bacterium]